MAPPRTDWLPATAERPLQLVLCLLGAGSFALAALLAARMLVGLNGWLGLPVFGFLILGLGLWRLHPLARQAAVLLLWMVVVVSVLGTINPFQAGEYLARGEQPPSVLVLLARIAPVVLVALWLLHVLGKYRHEFRRSS